MSFKALVTAFFLLFASCAVVMPDTAEAARMGGGRSFGSRPAMRSPAAPPATMQRQAQTNAAQRQNAVGQPNRGFLGGMGGIVGGLLAGTLLGSLLSGGGFSGGGFMDLLILGVLIYLGYRFLVRRRASSSAPSPAPAAAAGVNGGMVQTPFLQKDLSSQYADTSASAGAAQSWGGLSGGTISQEQGPRIPAGFDAEEFLQGAKLAYNRLQASWDKRDLNDIAQFATPAVMDALKEQLAQEPTPSHTEIILVNAQLLEVSEDGADERAQVYFDVLLREDPQQQTPSNAREIWHFVRERAGGTWKLDGIQQVTA